MTDKAPETAISGIIIIIVIFVVLLAFLAVFTDMGSQVTDIFDQVFFGEEKNVANAKQNTLDAQTDILSQVSKCAYDPTINPHSASSCFCSSGISARRSSA